MVDECDDLLSRSGEVRFLDEALPSHHELAKCNECGRRYVRTKATWLPRKKRERRPLCASCRRSGPHSPTWKGGHRSWRQGRFGRDRDGLSWRTQRRLCRERDKNTCVDCGRTAGELGYTLDVDHEVPYRISFSHALENLRTRCRTSHRNAEAQRKDIWNGMTLSDFVRTTIAVRRRPRCTSCKRPRQLNDHGMCKTCYIQNVLMTLARRLHSAGVTSTVEVGGLLGVNPQTAANWMFGYERYYGSKRILRLRYHSPTACST